MYSTVAKSLDSFTFKVFSERLLIAMIEIQESLLKHGHECLRECQAMLSRHDRAITVPDIESIIGKFNKKSSRESTTNSEKIHSIIISNLSSVCSLNHTVTVILDQV